MKSKFRVAIVLTALVLTAAWPAAAQGVGRSCDVSGVWYNGGYLLTVSPIGAGRYQMTFKYGFTPTDDWTGYVSDWVGEMSKAGGRSFEAFTMQYLAWRNQAGADAAALMFTEAGFPVTIDARFPQTSVIRARIELVDCNTLTNSIDLFWVHFPTEARPVAVPFVTLPDVDLLAFLAMERLDETYVRMTTACPSCPPAH